MTTTEKLTSDQVEKEIGVDLTCKTCRGSGMARNYTDDWLPILLRLHELGKIREQNRYPVGDDGRATLLQTWHSIIDIWENEAKPAHISVELAAKAVGIEKGSFYYGLREFGKR